ncbi:uncharacterized protein LOC126668982 [Mercurialis annua]|uniref:uncharacterized protein LOC126668982 n=1 Tax=Mercurialis annua TaxID=3986 RepID=UPI00215E9C72|nr:uncharacterized protein LOC126668982 [Mercurialis annua]XP_050218211.1 uncharacterized protein LOC126668982 [Mercurialis annua]XP_050218212.1 uncharacterized protein LOC126668982 [Mercurialis annua]XP_050218213.1 uncharacterized protein LOC126668982 [Mercurialis annua]
MNDQSSLMMNQPPMNQPPPSVQLQMLSQQQQPPPLGMDQRSYKASVQQPMLMDQRSFNAQVQSAQLPPMLIDQRTYNPWKQQQNQQLLNHPFNANNSKKKPRTNWKGKNVTSKDHRRMENPVMIANPNPNPNLSSTSGGIGGGGGYKPPSLNDLQNQNRMKARKYYHPKKKFNNNNSNNRFAPYAPRNTTSFIIRAKKAGGIASLVSPCPVTPAVLPTPIFSPSREMLGDMAKEEWGVDGYGSMKGLIRLRSPGNDADIHDDEEDEEGNGSSESDVEEHVEVERRLDHDLSRFEMIYPTYGGGGEYSYNNLLENRVDDQDTHIAQLEEENLTLKERLFLMERELGDLRRRMQFIERQQQGHGVMAVVEDVNEEVVENVSENDENESDGGSDIGAAGDGNNNEEVMEYICRNAEGRNVGNDSTDDVKESQDVCMEEGVPNHREVVEDFKNKDLGNQLGVNDEVIVKEDGVKGKENNTEVLIEKLTVKEELPKCDNSSDKIVEDQKFVEKDATRTE